MAESSPLYRAGYVMDASVIFKWYRHEEDRGKALGLREGLAGGTMELHAPDLVLAEVGNALRYNREFTKSSAGSSLAELVELGLVLHCLDRDLLREANATAWDRGLTFYDSLYVALARILGFPLVTADGEILRRLKGASCVVPLVHLPG